MEELGPIDAKEVEEMGMFGLDPTDPNHLKEWLETAPEDPDREVTNYSDDQFEIGGTPREEE